MEIVDDSVYGAREGKRRGYQRSRRKRKSFWLSVIRRQKGGTVTRRREAQNAIRENGVPGKLKMATSRWPVVRSQREEHREHSGKTRRREEQRGGWGTQGRGTGVTEMGGAGEEHRRRRKEATKVKEAKEAREMKDVEEAKENGGKS
jgi:hypothetical protein